MQPVHEEPIRIWKIMAGRVVDWWTCSTTAAGAAAAANLRICHLAQLLAAKEEISQHHPDPHAWFSILPSVKFFMSPHSFCYPFQPSCSSKGGTHTLQKTQITSAEATQPQFHQPPHSFTAQCRIKAMRVTVSSTADNCDSRREMLEWRTWRLRRAKRSGFQTHLQTCWTTHNKQLS